MAGASGQPPDHLTALDRLAAEPHRFTLFAALRLLEQTYGDRPRLGESRRAADDAVRLGQAPDLSFAPSDVSAFERVAPEQDRLEQYSFGMFGPNGALPRHLTEYAYEWRRQQEDATFVDFVNTFQHRLIALFYRAWADSDPATSFDRPEADRFRLYIGALLGLSSASASNRDAAPDSAKLSRSGFFGPQTRSAEGLEVILADYFGLNVELRPFVGAWMQIPAELYCRLGGDRESATLGSGATIGAATWQCQHKFELVLGPLTLATFETFLPGARGLRELHALVRLYTNDEWTWQLRLLLRDVEVPGVRLGTTGQLGWTSWLGGRRTTADDVVLQEPSFGPGTAAWAA
jgi:type VI secretion system protein ImpH